MRARGSTRGILRSYKNGRRDFEKVWQRDEEIDRSEEGL